MLSVSERGLAYMSAEGNSGGPKLRRCMFDCEFESELDF